MNSFLSEFFPDKPKKEKPRSVAPTAPSTTDAILLDRAMAAVNGEKFSRLYEGDWHRDYASQSEADAGLCAMLAFWTGDEEQIDRIFRTSSLYREKWDEVHHSSGATYGSETISRAVAFCAERFAGSVCGSASGVGGHKGSSRASSWRGPLIRKPGRGGRPEPVVANILTVLTGHPLWKGRLGWNDFGQRIMILGPLPFMPDGVAIPIGGLEWIDYHDIQTASWLQTETKMMVSPAVVSQGALAAAKENSFHPVRDYLLGLKWDGTNRLDGFLIKHFGAEDTAYVRAVGRKWLVSAVARVEKPGCKVDTMVILEGEQGKGKSRSARILAGESWFTDELDVIGTKDASLQLQGVWFVELAELDALNRSETSKIKAFMSKSDDRFRPPYGRASQRFPRQCVFVGTVNHGDYLRDETGGRRFWPVKCGKGDIDVEGLTRDRDQLWAEAVVAFRAGERWWLDDAALIRQAEEEQDGRLQVDAWEPLVAAFVERKTSTSVAEILLDKLGVETAKQGQLEQNRVARILRHLGWTRKQARLSASPASGSFVTPSPPKRKRGWRYFPPPES